MILRKGAVADPESWIERGNQFLQLKDFGSVSRLQFILACNFWCAV